MILKRTCTNGNGDKVHERRNVSLTTIVTSVLAIGGLMTGGMFIGEVLAEVAKIKGKADAGMVTQQYARIEEKMDSNKELYDEKLLRIGQKTDYIYDILQQQYGAVQVNTTNSGASGVSQ